MCKDNSFIWFLLLIVIFFNCNRINSSTPLSFDNFFMLNSSTPFFSGTGALL
ncbi:MAG: hypothetical protein N2749_02265 [Clostridia bacterium]|nr:hypothetical protein [Clostridia bacterium]